jgi:hypothetical protein
MELIDEGHSNYNHEYNLITTFRKRIKILKQKACALPMYPSTITAGTGISMNLERHIRIRILKGKGRSHADVKLRYYSYRNTQQIKILSAQTYNLDVSGNIVITKVEKKRIYDKPVDKRISEQVFTFHEVKAGSIIEYKYTLNNVGLADWYFRKSIPVRYSRYRVDFPPEIEVYSMPFCVQPLKLSKSSKLGRDQHHFPDHRRLQGAYG